MAMCLRCIKGRHRLCDKTGPDGNPCDCKICTGLVTCEHCVFPHKLDDDGTTCRRPKPYEGP